MSAQVLRPLSKGPGSWHGDGDRQGSESVLDYYSDLPTASRQPSPGVASTVITPGGRTIPVPVRAIHREPFISARPTESPHQSSESLRAKRASWAFGAEAPREASDKWHSHHDSHTTPVSMSQAKQHLPDSLGKSISMSRIPISKDTASLINSGSINRRRVSLHQPAIAKGSTILLDHDRQTKGMPRSVSVPMHDPLCTPRRDENGTGDKYNHSSLPSRKSQRQRTSNSIKRSASLSSSPKELEVKDHKSSREEQVRRLQAINNAPSGVPPWLDQFQPDPRLPAEEQMLPTVARKLALAKWMEQGNAEEDFSAEKATQAHLAVSAAPAHDRSNAWVDTTTGNTLNHVVTRNNECEVQTPLERAMSNSNDRRSLERVHQEVSQSSQTFLGQSPSRTGLANHATPNFSRRSLLSISAQISPQDQEVISSQIKDNRPGVSSEPSRLETAPTGSHHANSKADTDARMSKTDVGRRERPMSGFDHDEDRVKKAGCCIVM